MKNLQAVTSLLILLFAGFASAEGQTISLGREKLSLCNTESLPNGVKVHLKQEFANWKIQESKYLSANALERWSAEKPQRCAGLAEGSFNAGKSTSYAILLIPIDNQHFGYRLVLFSQKGNKHNYEFKILEKSHKTSVNTFIHASPLSKFADDNSIRKFGILSGEALLLFHAGEQEYEVDFYYLTKNGYLNDPVDY